MAGIGVSQGGRFLLSPKKGGAALKRAAKGHQVAKLSGWAAGEAGGHARARARARLKSG